MRTQQIKVQIDGADPSGSVSARLLREQCSTALGGEREHFPLFSIGERQLPQSTQYIEEVRLLRDGLAGTSRFVAQEQLCWT